MAGKETFRKGDDSYQADDADMRTYRITRCVDGKGEHYDQIDVHGDEALRDRIVDLLNQRPVVAEQQPARKVDAFRNMFAILHNLGWRELVHAGAITEPNPMRLWNRYEVNLPLFVLKLDDARLDALYALVQSRQPERYRDA